MNVVSTPIGLIFEPKNQRRLNSDLSYFWTKKSTAFQLRLNYSTQLCTEKSTPFQLRLNYSTQLCTEKSTPFQLQLN